MSFGMADADLAAALDLVGEAGWRDLAGRSVFVTGGTGYVGKWLLATFAYANRELELNAHLTVLSRDPDRFRCDSPDLAFAHGIDLAAGDVTSFELEGRFSHVIHAAADVVRHTTPSEMLRTSTAGTERVLRFARESGAEAFLFTSSGAVYGPHPAELPRMPENFAGAPSLTDTKSAYGEGKRAAELLTHAICSEGGIRRSVARLYAQVGPHLPLDKHFAMGNFLLDAIDGRPCHIAGDGTPVRTYLYGSDLAGWLWAMLLRGEDGLVCNVGSEEEVSIRELAERVNAVLGSVHGVSVGGLPQLGLAPSRYVPDTSRIRSALALPEPTTLDDAIARTAAWYTSRSTAS